MEGMEICPGGVELGNEVVSVCVYYVQHELSCDLT